MLMTIEEIYRTYDIPPNLQDHQLTVASVAHAVCGLVRDMHETDDVVRTCLLHDMGNIIKFKFDSTAFGLVLENVEHWRSVKRRFIEIYGPDEHAATVAIAREIGVSDRILQLLDRVGFSHAVETLGSGDRAGMIAAYSDMRVSPTGVTSLSERLDNIHERYGNVAGGFESDRAFGEMERILFTDATGRPEDITDVRIAKTKETLTAMRI